MLSYLLLLFVIVYAAAAHSWADQRPPGGGAYQWQDVPLTDSLTESSRLQHGLALRPDAAHENAAFAGCKNMYALCPSTGLSVSKAGGRAPFRAHSIVYGDWSGR